MAEITILIALVAGFVSFLSPCILPLIPAFLAYLSGTSIDEAKQNKAKARLHIFLNTIFFVLGFAVVFSLIGVLLNSVLTSIAYDLRIWLSRIGGAIIIGFGLYLLGILKLSFLDVEHKIKVRKFRYNYPTSFLFGVAFAAGWTPCVGAVLGSILTLAITSPGVAFSLLLAYSIGLGIPFLLTGIFTAQASSFIQKAGPILKYFNIVMGTVLIILGILVFTNKIFEIAVFPITLEMLN
ncbi:MAG: cytochrome C biogenesis protein [Candidatus Aenigmarchaeota archaeon]|nr:cytochrome C biogenesis protein [Candidatus Aenigmarchaeota archaeon]